MAIDYIVRMTPVNPNGNNSVECLDSESFYAVLTDSIILLQDKDTFALGKSYRGFVNKTLIDPTGIEIRALSYDYPETNLVTREKLFRVKPLAVNSRVKFELGILAPPEDSKQAPTQ